MTDSMSLSHLLVVLARHHTDSSISLLRSARQYLVLVSLTAVVTLNGVLAFAQPSAVVQKARLDAIVPALLQAEKAAGVGIAFISNGEIAWQAYYGEQGPGVPVTSATVFNTASVAKTITAEILIALSAEGLIDLDEPIAPYVDHPDLSDDPRYKLLTSRLLLSHRAGLLNWAYAYEDGKLAFDHDPDTRFSYSGAGVELAARYAEAKTQRTLQNLAFDLVLEPANVTELSMGIVEPWMDGRITTPMDARGEYRSITELNSSLAQGDANSAADDLLTTVPAYARFITALIDSAWLNDDAVREREKVITSLAEDPVYRCPDLEWLTCPSSFGHSIGWQVWQYGDHTVVKHSGSDAGENALVYFSPDTGNGAVIFVNGANGWVVITRILEAIGDEPLIAAYYRGLIETVMGRSMPEASF